jgi:hypothetical protein
MNTKKRSRGSFRVFFGGRYLRRPHKFFHGVGYDADGKQGKMPVSSSSVFDRNSRGSVVFLNRRLIGDSLVMAFARRKARRRRASCHEFVCGGKGSRRINHIAFQASKERSLKFCAARWKADH